MVNQEPTFHRPPPKHEHCQGWACHPSWHPPPDPSQDTTACLAYKGLVCLSVLLLSTCQKVETACECTLLAKINKSRASGPPSLAREKLSGGFETRMPLCLSLSLSLCLCRAIIQSLTLPLLNKILHGLPCVFDLSLIHLAQDSESMLNTVTGRESTVQTRRTFQHAPECSFIRCLHPFR